MKILILPGDGIGPEIMAATGAALEALNDTHGLKLAFEERVIGLASLETEGSTLPDAVIEAIEAADGTVVGPVHTVAYPPASEGGVNPSATMRKRFDLYANIRPSRARPGVPAMTPKMDLVIARENTEGFYADRNMFQGTAEFMPTEGVALSVRKITVQGSRRIAESAFDLAGRRRNKVTVVHKANVLKVSDGLFRDTVREVAKSHPEVELDEVLIDAMAALLVRTPEAFDVVLTTNMFGDILSDEAAELSGGLGLGGSLNAGDDHAIAQAAHGSAPDIAGQGIANPTALMVSVAMLLEWLGAGHGRDDLSAAAAAFNAAVDAVLADPANHTPDLGGSAKTADIGRAVADAISK
ncbi:MAG TPA: isocitrate/isopropylmalate dehydrogenase family protein [Rhodospirillales bacterium]|jgi:3-isopropylmalate dehydrogenase|nr:isocitrate/isopropylmalate family dehydrogenase [Rhodospirillales bacterium]MEE3051312.1 isocitrate/isopropylmalate family dehydrogenase [Pseudomonadota bacterium]PPR62986.1 MAG: Homoisocitrate dehydrogenase [Alphaproteobacteria bacterium MarineAlpha3_Bin3]HIM42242.1 isocitrate/isopropylmalate dehydrogenase family protein [Rhodospirillales bacterium]HIN22668.1 isocitrate/isopropylmalate dehydrogenase family protein [Rhodospirillales bacterium]